VRKTTGKGSRYVEVPLDAFADLFSRLGYEADDSAAIREGRVEVTYSKVIRECRGVIPGKFDVEQWHVDDHKRVLKSKVVEAKDMDACVAGVVFALRLKDFDAKEDSKAMSPREQENHRIVDQGLGFYWSVRPHWDKLGDVICRVYTSATTSTDATRGVGEDAIRVCLLFRYPDGHVRGIGHEQRVYRTGTVEGVMRRLSGRIEEAEGSCGEDSCPKCGLPTYLDSGNCIDRDCREQIKPQDLRYDGKCSLCQSPKYRDSGRCSNKKCDGYRTAPSWALGGPCQKCNGPTYTDSGKCLVKACREAGGRAKKPCPECEYELEHGEPGPYDHHTCDTD
jgi:hypothetical protein